MAASSSFIKRFQSSIINKLYKRHIYQLYRIKIENVSNLSSNNDLLIASEPRRFNNLRFDLSTLNDDSIEEQLDFSISHWKSNGTRGVWAYTPSNKSHLIPTLLKVPPTLYCYIYHITEYKNKNMRERI